MKFTSISALVIVVLYQLFRWVLIFVCMHSFLFTDHGCNPKCSWWETFTEGHQKPGSMCHHVSHHPMSIRAFAGSITRTGHCRPLHLDYTKAPETYRGLHLLGTNPAEVHCGLRQQSCFVWCIRLFPNSPLWLLSLSMSRGSRLLMITVAQIKRVAVW